MFVVFIYLQTSLSCISRLPNVLTHNAIPYYICRRVLALVKLRNFIKNDSPPQVFLMFCNETMVLNSETLHICGTQALVILFQFFI